MQLPLLRLGTRGSPLALAQAEETRRRLAEAHPDLASRGAVEIVVIKTTGDRIQDRALLEIGGKGLFTKEIEEALADGRIDVAVHSMKDVPTRLPDGFGIIAVLEREDPRDAWISRDGGGLMDLPEGAVVGTASLRRQAQVRHLRPDLRVETSARQRRHASRQAGAWGGRRDAPGARGLEAARPGRSCHGPSGTEPDGPGRGPGRHRTGDEIGRRPSPWVGRCAERSGKRKSGRRRTRSPGGSRRVLPYADCGPCGPGGRGRVDSQVDGGAPGRY